MRYIICLLAFTFSFNCVSNEPNTIQHYQFQARYEFGHKVLELALKKIKTHYEIIAPNRQMVNEARGEYKVISGELDIQWMSTSEKRESKMIPIKVPLYRGLLGLRLILVPIESQQRFKNIKTVKELSNFVGGHGAHWGDLPVYKANGLPVRMYGDYETLFRLLEDKRFDYFHRGVNEIWQELALRQDTLAVADGVMLFYPHPVYFFVTKSRPKLASDIEQGLKKATQDGSLKALFKQYHQKFIDQANLESRTLIRLKNPVNPPSMPAIDTSWWLPDHFRVAQ